MNYPEYLKVGDTIGICAPSDGIADEVKIRKLELAEKHDLPVVIHSRESIQDVYDILV